MKRKLFKMSAAMKAEIEEKRKAQVISEQIREANSPKKVVIPDKRPLILPEDFTGRDLKRAKKLIKNRTRFKSDN